MERNATWRPLTPEDVSSLLLVASQIHPDLSERFEVFAERVKLFPKGCLALTDRNTKALVGYAISHPIRHRQPPALDILLGEIDRDANQYYIHDLAILPDYSGKCQRGDGDVGKGGGEVPELLSCECVWYSDVLEKVWLWGSRVG
jgi:hypothetical protein